MPVTPAEQIESTERGLRSRRHGRAYPCAQSEREPSSDPELFAKVQEGVVKHCPGMIVQFSTGGRGRSQNERGRMLYLRPEMASLATGSVNFATQIYEDSPQLVEELARSMLEIRRQARDRGLRRRDALQCAQPRGSRSAQAAVPGAVRDGHTERAAPSPQAAGIPDLGTEPI